ncbi:reticulon-4 receptor-like isoform X1 [Oncorhynchus clarkii lewisi]|uniref:reticulon-4 receptor-like isoform X1 n=2 Tax=Oncorhynchus clarkii lewisi TaxID=490388 RepID=UPI0039B98323
MLFPALLALSSVVGSKECPHHCLCYEHSDLVDCRARGFLQVPHGLSHGTWLLDLGGNLMIEVRSRAFAGLWSLRVLVLSDSGIQLLQPEAFYSLSFLEKLDMSRNKLLRLPPDFSHSLSSVRELRLDHNTLERLEVSSLEHLESLEKLDLSHNHITFLQPGAFRGLSRLRHLYLHANQLGAVRHGSLSMLPVLEALQLGQNNITHIDTEALAPLHSLTLLGLEGNQLQHLKFKTFLSLHTAGTHLQLAGNPWNCDCDLHRVFSKLLSVRHLHVDDYHNVTCHEPLQLAGASLAWVDSQLCMAETATVLVITVTVLVTVLAAVVMAEHTRKKNQHGKNWDAESQSQER